jgi:hypothetical protein
MREILIYSFPLWLLLLGILLLVLSGRPILRPKAVDAKSARFKSLRTTSPILNTLIMVSVVGKPFLEHLQKNNWDTGFIDPQIVMPLVWVFIVSLWALLAAVIIFFFRAIRNINVLSGERLRSPYSALFMLLPISNMIVIPYLEYFAYQRSWALAMPHQASKLRAALLVVCSFWAAPHQSCLRTSGRRSLATRHLRSSSAARDGSLHRLCERRADHAYCQRHL